MTSRKDKKAPELMNEYSSVAEMARNLSEDKALGERLSKNIRDRVLVDVLMGLRTRRGMSQSDIAAKMDCTQSKISKLESDKDDDLRLGDLRAYTEALGFQMTIRLTTGKQSLVDQLRGYTVAIRKLLGRLTKYVAHEDGAISVGATGFALDVMKHMQDSISTTLDMVSKAVEQLPSKLPPETPEIVELQTKEGDDEEDKPSHVVHEPCPQC